MWIKEELGNITVYLISVFAQPQTEGIEGRKTMIVCVCVIVGNVEILRNLPLKLK